MVICTNTAIDGAALVAERLRHPVEITDGSGARQTIQIGISIGVAAFSASVDSEKSWFKPQAKRYTAQKEKAEIESSLMRPKSKNSHSPVLQKIE